MNNQINPNETMHSNMTQNTQFNTNTQASRYINQNQPAQFSNQGAMVQNQPAQFSNQGAMAQNQPIQFRNQGAMAQNQPIQFSNQGATMQNPSAQFSNQGAVTQIQPNAAYGIPFMQQTDSQMLDYTDFNTSCPLGSNDIDSPNCAFTQTNISESFDTGVFPATQPMPNIVYPNAQPFPPEVYPPIYEVNPPVTDFDNIGFVPAPNCIYGDTRLECYVGQRVEVQFVIGNTVLDKVGVLRAVDSENFALESEENGNLIIGSLHSVWLVTILQ